MEGSAGELVEAREDIRSTGTGDGPASAEELPESAEEEREMMAEASSAAEADARPGGISSLAQKVSTVLRSRESLRQELTQARTRMAELEAINAEQAERIAQLEQTAADHEELQRAFEEQVAEQQTQTQQVRAELESIGIPEAQAPAAETAEVGGSLLEQYEAMEAGPEKTAFLKKHQDELRREERERGA